MMLPELLGCATNPVSCALTIFSQKFPFDVFSGFVAGQELACPLMNFFGQEFEVCFLYEAIAFIKYPVILSLIVKVIIHF